MGSSIQSAWDKRDHHKRPFKWSALISYLEASGLMGEESKKELAQSYHNLEFHL